MSYLTPSHAIVHPSFFYIERTPQIIIQHYINNLTDLLSTSTFDIILGDFNINYFNDKTIVQLKQLMNFYSYFQIVKKATFVSSGSLLDHIYVKQTIDSKLKVL